MASISSCLFLPTAKPSFLLKSSKLFSFKPPNSIYFHNKSRIGIIKLSKRSLPFVLRASTDVTAAAAAAMTRPGGAIESDKLPSDVRKRAMDAIEACGRRVTVGDVASKAGLKLNEAQKALQALAADTDGFLEVSDEGDVLYVFPKGYRSNLAAKSFRIKAEPLIEKAKSTAEYVIRVSFGTALVASIVLVYTAIIAILVSSKSDKEDSSRRRGGSSYDIDFTFISFSSREQRVQQREDEGGMNFIDSVFSFVFGDGDPNQGIEEERWKLIGQYIVSNDGVVTAEELAPYLDVETTEKMDDDSYILPVLLRFDGQPEVNEEGNILYRFPSLQRTATPQRSGRKEYVGRRWADWVGGVEQFFKEKKWQFSKTNISERAMVIGLGGLNLFGVIILNALLRDAPASGFISFVTVIFPLLQVYAGSFFAVPVIRWFFVWKTNAEIEKRNRAREIRAQALASPDPLLRQKLLSARDMAQKTYIGQDRIVYSTDRDLHEQDYEAKEWDRRFRELE